MIVTFLISSCYRWKHSKHPNERYYLKAAILGLLYRILASGCVAFSFIFILNYVTVLKLFFLSKKYSFHWGFLHSYFVLVLIIGTLTLCFQKICILLENEDNCILFVILFNYFVLKQMSPQQGYRKVDDKWLLYLSSGKHKGGSWV